MKEANDRAAKLTHTVHTSLASLFCFAFVLNELSFSGFLHPPIMAFVTPSPIPSHSSSDSLRQSPREPVRSGWSHCMYPLQPLARLPFQHTQIKDWQPERELSSMQFRNKFFSFTLLSSNYTNYNFSDQDKCYWKKETANGSIYFIYSHLNCEGLEDTL